MNFCRLVIATKLTGRNIPFSMFQGATEKILDNVAQMQGPPRRRNPVSMAVLLCEGFRIK